MSKPKIALFFGAGSETAYGMPNGGEFALNIFQMSPQSDRESFRQMLSKIDANSYYASSWLPENYKGKRLFVFGKSDFDRMVQSSMEYRKDVILSYMDNFDSKVQDILRKLPFSEQDLRSAFYEKTNTRFGAVRYSQSICLNRTLATSTKLFDSNYFSAFLKILETDEGNADLEQIVKAILELLIGAFGQDLVHRLNDELFERAPSNISVFDDLTGVFHLDYRRIGQTSLETVLKQKPRQGKPHGIAEMFAHLGWVVLEDIISHTIDYQELIDSHFRFLYTPKAHWAKFTRIAIFLHTVRRYICERAEVNKQRIEDGPGYYHDLSELISFSQILAIGTTNYTNNIEIVLKRLELEVPVYHLNGNILESYDPYANAIVQNQHTTEYPRLLVPFLFTQSGIKPLTSVTMAEHYVNLYKAFKNADIIVIIGFGFNVDDGHINGLLRRLSEEEKKRLVILHYGTQVDADVVSNYQNKLRLDALDKIEVLPVDLDRKVEGQLWYEKLKELL